MSPTIATAGLRRVIGAEVVSNFGSMMSRLALPWIAVLTLQATPWQMAWLALAGVLAGTLSALVLGSAIDRLPTRAVMIGADLSRCALLAALALAAAGGWLSFAMLLAAAAAIGVLTLAFELARSAWIALSARREELERANAQLAAGSAISEAAAFAITGAVFQWIGSVAALLADAASYLASAWLLRGVAPARPGAAPAAGGGATGPATTTLGRTLAFLLRNRALRSLALLEALVALSGGISATSYMLYVSRDLALPPSALGVVFALGGAGAALGAVFAPLAGRRWGSGPALAAGLAAAALGAAFVPLAGASAAALAALLLLAAQQLAGDAGETLYSVHDRSLRQSLVPRDALARADGALRTLGQAATVAGILAGGALATAYGARFALAVAAAALGGAAALAAVGCRTGALPGRRSTA